ncbi:MAG: hypothetical protein F8N37_22920 [Telmatospirillum sp.]|nr:hypothetical protein [Telmatospirillum sp.]
MTTVHDDDPQDMPDRDRDGSGASVLWLVLSVLIVIGALGLSMPSMGQETRLPPAPPRKVLPTAEPQPILGCVTGDDVVAFGGRRGEFVCHPVQDRRPHAGLPAGSWFFDGGPVSPQS